MPNQPLMDVTMMIDNNEELHGQYKREIKSKSATNGCNDNDGE
jgi:hypothetical protein